MEFLLDLYSSRLFCFCFKQKTAYEMRISDWSSDVCSSDLGRFVGQLGSQRRRGRDVFGFQSDFTPAAPILDFAFLVGIGPDVVAAGAPLYFFCALVPPDRVVERMGQCLTGRGLRGGFVFGGQRQIGRASCREGERQYGEILGV